MERIVLATGYDMNQDEYRLCFIKEKEEFATWFMGTDVHKQEKIYLQGHYFNNPKKAIQDLKSRVCLSEVESYIEFEYTPLEIINKNKNI